MNTDGVAHNSEGLFPAADEGLGDDPELHLALHVPLWSLSLVSG